MLKKCQKISKFCSLGTKYKINKNLGIKTSDFILQRRKSKLAIKVGTENIFYSIFYLKIPLTIKLHTYHTNYYP
jgi:long-subunit fatty acid transport protein